MARPSKQRGEDFGFIEDVLANLAVQSAMFDNIDSRIDGSRRFDSLVLAKVEALIGGAEAGGFEPKAATRKAIALAQAVAAEGDDLKREIVVHASHVVASFRELTDIIERRIKIVRGRGLSATEEEAELLYCYRLLILDDLTLRRWGPRHPKLGETIDECLDRSAKLQAEISARFPSVVTTVKSEMAGT